MLLPLCSCMQAQLGRSAVTAAKVWGEERLDGCWESEGSREAWLDVRLGLECGCAECDQNRQPVLSEEDGWLKDRRSGMARGCNLFVWNKVGLDGPKLLQEEGVRLWSEVGVKGGVMSSDLTCTEASPDMHHHPRHSLAVFLLVISVSLLWLL